jgi:hypothetical protein
MDTISFTSSYKLIKTGIAYIICVASIAPPLSKKLYIYIYKNECLYVCPVCVPIPFIRLR